MSDHLDGIDFETTITLPVSAHQFHELCADQVAPGNSRVLHKVAVGPHYIPGLWAVVVTKEFMEPNGNTYLVTLARVQ